MDLERPAFARRFVQLGARCKQEGKKDKKKILFEIRIGKTLGKRDTRGKRPKGASSSGNSHKRVCDHFQECQKEPACDSWHPPECSDCTPKEDSHVMIRVYSSTQGKAGEYKSGKATIAKKLEETKDLNCELKKKPRR